MEDRSEKSIQKKNVQKKNVQKKDIHKKGINRKGIHKNDFHKKNFHRNSFHKKDSRKNGMPQRSVPEEWLYLAMEGVSLADLYQCLKEEKRWRAEYWEEAQVLEIGIPDAGSIDLESMETDMEDRKLCSYMEETKAKAVYAVTVMPEYFEKAEAVMQYIAEKTGGIFCGDTEDFLPEIKAASGMPVQDTDR